MNKRILVSFVVIPALAYLVAAFTFWDVLWPSIVDEGRRFGYAAGAALFAIWVYAFPGWDK